MVQLLRRALRDARRPKRDPERDLIRVLVGSVVTAGTVVAVLSLIQARPDWATAANATDNPTPYGFTIGLLLFAVPALTGLGFLLFDRTFAGHRKPLLIALGMLCAFATLVDVLGVGTTFFRFPNHGASWSAVEIRGLNWSTWTWDPLPLEDLFFYLAAIVLSLVLYIWGSVSWLGVHSADHFKDRTHPCWHGDKWTFSFGMWEVAGLVASAALILAAWALQGWLNPAGTFPLYFLYLVLAAILPSVFLLDIVRQHVNWHAFGVTTLYIVAMSFVFEVSLALPYQWWAFADHTLIGIRFTPWWGVPIEEPILYLVNTYVIVLFYETVLIWWAHRTKQGPPAEASLDPQPVEPPAGGATSGSHPRA